MHTHHPLFSLQIMTGFTRFNIFLPSRSATAATLTCITSSREGAVNMGLSTLKIKARGIKVNEDSDASAVFIPGDVG